MRGQGGGVDWDVELPLTHMGRGVYWDLGGQLVYTSNISKLSQHLLFMYF